MGSFERGREVNFDSVFVIQLLGPKDKKTGLTLFREVLEPEGKCQHLHTSYVNIASDAGLVPALWDVARECERRGLSPFVHIETHGSKLGLGLEPAVPIPWDDIVPPLRAINVTSRMNLVLTLAACHGMSMVRSLTPLEPSPVWGLFGPNEQILEPEVETGFQTFYATLLKTLDLNAAVRALQTEAALMPEAWHLRTAEFFLTLVYGRFLDDYRRPGVRERSVQRVLAKLRRRARKNPTYTLPPDARSRVREHFADEEAHFQRTRRQFLMLDRFPANQSRFPLSRDDCVRLWEVQRAAYEADAL